MVDTTLTEIDELVALQASPEVTVNEAIRVLESLAGAAMRGNRVLNSGLFSWQEGTTFAAIANETYFADLFRWDQIGPGVVTVSRSTDTANETMPFSIKVDVTTLDASVAATDVYVIKALIEGTEIREALFGVSTARKIHLSFWVKSNLDGIYCVSFRNDAFNRCYVIEYTIDSADVWQQIHVSFTADITGTWEVDESRGLLIDWCFGVGSNREGTPDLWEGFANVGTIDQVNLLASTSNEFFLSNPRLYIGVIPATSNGFPVAEYSQALEQIRIKRMFERIDSEVASQQFGAGQVRTITTAAIPISYLPKRIIPTISVSAAGDFDVEQVDGTLEPVTGLTGADIGTSRAEMDVTVDANLAAGRATILRDDGGSNSFIDIDARY